MSDAVRQLLDQIEQLPEEDRVVLEERLAELAEADWKREAEQAAPARPPARNQPGDDRPSDP